MKEAKKAADVVKEVTHMVSIEWLKADSTIDSKWSSKEFKLGSIFEWDRHALTKINVSSAPTPRKKLTYLKKNEKILRNINL